MDMVIANPANAKLPAVYERAKESLATCARIDECAEWASKAEAIASYARQAEDESLLQTATRIKARAIRRCGELLKEIKPARGANQNIGAAGGPKVQTRKDVAAAAGLSPRQQKEAQRVASVPTRAFEAAVESAKPPTVTELAERGRKPSTAHLKGRDPKEYAASTQAQGALRTFVQMAERTTPRITVRGAVPREYPLMKAHAKTAIAWLTKLLAEIETSK